MLIARAAQRQRCGDASRAGADDDDRFRLHVCGVRCIARARQLSPHENAPVLLIDLPAIEWIERRSAFYRARFKVEAGVVPWTANGSVDQQAVDEVAMVVSAQRSNRKVLVAALDDEDLLGADTADEPGALVGVCRRYTQLQVR